MKVRRSENYYHLLNLAGRASLVIGILTFFSLFIWFYSMIPHWEWNRFIVLVFLNVLAGSFIVGITSESIFRHLIVKFREPIPRIKLPKNL